MEKFKEIKERIDYLNADVDYYRKKIQACFSERAALEYYLDQMEGNDENEINTIETTS